MFDALKKKLSGWFKEKPKEEPEEEVKGKEEKKKEVGGEKKEKKTEKKDGRKKVKKKGVGRVAVREEKTEAEAIVEEIETIDNGVEEKLREGADEIEKEVPVKFDVGKEKFEPEVDKIKDETEGAKAEDLETPVEELREEIDEDEKGGFFFKLKKKLTTSVLKQEEFDDIFEELEMVLLENNVSLRVVGKIREELGKDVVGISVKKKDVEKIIVESLKSSIESVLIEGDDLIEKIKGRKEWPYVILFFGINGSGKTTSVAKLAWRLKKEGVDCVIAAADTFRAASIEQLEEHGKRVGVEIVKGDYGKDPAAVVFDAISYAKKHKKKVVLIDTAGRMYTKSNLMKEMEKIVRVANADMKVFVGESITGNDATEQAKMFNETAGIDGIILTKADVDEKAGAILSVSYISGKPILFLGTGQKYEDLEKFTKEGVLGKLGLD
ncbi:MAG: signal recognition particle-docking protein FtsY [archaeon]